jgi:Terminase large subunit, T4likevirus-type, N-terminal
MKPTQYQSDVLAAPEDLSLFLGGSRGSGKTTLALQLIIRSAVKYPNSKHLYVRNHLKSLNEVQDSLAYMLVGAYGKGMKINRSDNTFKLPNGSMIFFAPLADNLDAAKLQGLSFCTITADEYGNYTPAQMRYLDMLRANLRGTSGCPHKFCVLANPAGIGHVGCVNRFTKKLTAWVPATLADGVEWLSCPGTYLQNPNLPKNYEQSIRASAGKDLQLQLAWLEGRWDIARGSILADVLDENIQKFEATKLGFDPNQRGSYFFLAGDFGITSPSVVYLCSHLLAPLGRFPRGSLCLIDEVSSADPDDFSVGLQWSVSYLADRVNLACDEWGMRNRVGVMDDYRGLDDSTVLGLLARHGLHLEKPRKGRLENLAMAREMLFNSLTRNGRPGLWISNRCVNWWETVPLIARDAARPDLPSQSAVDHAADASFYGISHIPRIARNRYYIP